jgi:membrane protein DedA with SNARE-associated domain
MEALIAQWGYLAIVLGTFFEGETVLALGGFVAHQGYLRLDLVILSAFAGSLCGDQFWFQVGRRFGRRWIERHPGKAGTAEQVGRLLDRWGTWYVLSFRFFYGLRTVSPVAIGLSSITVSRFALLNAISAAVWAAVVGGLGYECGNAAEAILGRVEFWQHRILAGAVVALAICGLYLVVRRYLRQRLQ